MDYDKSLDDYYNIIAALLHDFHKSHGEVFNHHSLKLTLRKVESRLRAEGLSFLTKTLPRLGKAFDKALTNNTPMNSSKLGFKPQPGSKLPKFLGELFNKVLLTDGTVRPHPCANSVRDIRQALFLFYKLELPYTYDQELEVVTKFERTEDELKNLDEDWKSLRSHLDNCCHCRRPRGPEWALQAKRQEVAREARILLSGVFSSFNPRNIYPRHGPGVVSTKERLWAKYHWTNVSGKITDVYPFDEYYTASMGHVCDTYRTFPDRSETQAARVILVPKDSRGPRLISCEPVDFQWIQQGLGRAIVRHVERHPLTRYNVRFTDQNTNRFGALLGSRTGKYVTLDLNEASDRVSSGLVHLLFPEHLAVCLEACRSSRTELPDGRILNLHKYAPMGSSLCFPVLALTVWSILTAGAPDADTREGIAVYGDDVIVPTHYALKAIEHLESFGLKINRDKSCTSGLFRESCGMDAFNGIDVTPVKIKTPWSSRPSASSYTSWIAYANSMYERKYYTVYDKIVESLLAVYGKIPDKSMHLACPSLVEVPLEHRPTRRRVNKSLQKLEYRVWDIKSPVIRKEIDGWSMLLRYFAEVGNDRNQSSRSRDGTPRPQSVFQQVDAFSASMYTSRRTSMLVRRWR